MSQQGFAHISSGWGGVGVASLHFTSAFETKSKVMKFYEKFFLICNAAANYY